MALYTFDESNGTLLTTITGGSVCTDLLATAAQMVTNGSGSAILNVNHTYGGIVKAGSNRSIVTMAAGSNLDECVGAMVACDASNTGYRAVIDGGGSGTTFTRVKRLQDEAFQDYWTFTTPIDSADGAITLDLQFDGTNLTLDVIQNASVYQSFSHTPGSPLARTGTGFFIQAFATTAEILSWDDGISAATRLINDIDSDNSVQAGQTNVNISVSNLDAAPAIQTVTLGGEALTVNSWSDTVVNVDIPSDINLEWGQSTYTLSLTDDTGEVTLSNITLTDRAGWETITLSSLPDEGATESFYELSKTDAAVGNFTAAASDILAFESQTGLTVDSQSIPTVAPPATVTGAYKWWDASLNTWTNESSFTVNDQGSVVDAVKPVITLNGDSPMVIVQGNAWIDPGATVTDNVDATRQISADTPPNINTVGSQVIAYNASDVTGNDADEVTRTVNVVASDVTPNQFAFLDVNNAELNTLYENTQQIVDVDAGQTITATNGQVSNDGGSTWASSCQMVIGQTYVKAAITTSGTNSLEHTVIVTVNGISDTFSVTTKAAVTLSYTTPAEDALINQSTGSVLSTTVPIVEAWTAAPEDGGSVVDSWTNVTVLNGIASFSGSAVSESTDYLLIFRSSGNVPTGYYRTMGQFS